MKKILSLLFVALLTMSAWADTTVTFIPGETVGTNTSANALDQMSRDGVIISCTSGAFLANPYRFGGGSTTTISRRLSSLAQHPMAITTVPTSSTVTVIHHTREATWAFGKAMQTGLSCITLHNPVAPRLSLPFPRKSLPSWFPLYSTPMAVSLPAVWL